MILALAKYPAELPLINPFTIDSAVTPAVSVESPRII